MSSVEILWEPGGVKGGRGASRAGAQRGKKNVDIYFPSMI